MELEPTQQMVVVYGQNIQLSTDHSWLTVQVFKVSVS